MSNETTNETGETGPVKDAPVDNLKAIVDPSSILDNLEKSITEQVEDTSQKSNESKDSEVKPPPLKRNNAVQDTEIKLDPFSDNVNKHRPEVFVTPSVPTIETFERLQSVTKEEVVSRNNAREWSQAINSGLPLSSFDGAGDRILARAGTKWVQNIKFGNFNIGPSASRTTFEEGTVLTGSQALAATQRHLGLGGNFTNVLPHSGFWITFKPPLEETIFELNRQFHNIKTEVGRSTYGLLLSSYTGLVNELFTRFALNSMLRNSLKDVDDILKMISVHDIDIINWSYICTMYPNGFNHKAACIADPTACSHIVEDLINVRRLFFINQNALTETQLQHLTNNSQAAMDVDSVLKYREELRKSEERIIKLCEDTEDEVHMVLRVPSAFDYFDSTNRWINGIGTKVIEALGADSSFNERNQLITDHATVTQMRKYAHWVQEIRVASGRIIGREDIESNLDLMSTSIKIREEFDQKVSKYIEDTKFAVIGIPDFKCPNCHKYQISEDEVNPINKSIIAIDVIQTFFTILVQRVQSAKE